MAIVGLFRHFIMLEMLLLMVPAIFYIIAYILNRSGHNRLAAGLTIGTVFLVVFTSAISQHNSILLGFVLIALFLTSVFFYMPYSVIVYVVTITVILVIPRIFPGWIYSYYPQLTFLIGITGFLTVITAAISQRDINQIDKQSRFLEDENCERLQIEAELRESRDELEIRVAERTADLDELNIKLNTELAEKEKVELVLKKSEERFRSIYENAVEGIFQSTLDGSYLHVNNAMAQIFGYQSPDEMIALVGYDIGHKVYLSPESNTQFLDLLKKEKEIKGYESLNLRKDGSQIWTSTNARLVTNTDDGNLYTEGFLIDITKRKQTEHALSASDKRFRSLFENAPISLWEEDFTPIMAYFNELRRSGVTNFRDYFESHPEAVASCAGKIKIIKVNEATLELYKAKSNKDFIESIEKVFCEESFPVFREELIALAEGKTKFDGEAINLTLTGERIHVALSLIVATSSNDSAHRVFVSISDITKHKLAEQTIQQDNERISQVVTELGMRNQEMTTLTEMSDLFQACRTSAEISTIITKYASRLFPTELGSVSLFDESGMELNVISTWGQMSRMKPTFSPNDCWALRLGRMHIENNSDSKIVCPHLLRLSPLASLCIPLVAQGETLGVISLIKPGLPETDSGILDINSKSFSEVKIQTVTSLTEHIGLALSNLKLRDTLRHQAIRDPLTNLFNRRYMEETFEREIKHAERKGTQVGIIMIDIDHFKQFNDAFGHEAGDIILQELGHFFQTHIRAEDVACRYGGEEFTIILPDSSPSNTVMRAENLREGAKRLNVNSNGINLQGITLSLGISIFPEHGNTSETLLRAADQALYRAKAEGRDRVVMAS
jgi:diguanylate cyclase (GGDEF)-like protein/PAS domain S-box-containing protein